MTSTNALTWTTEVPTEAGWYWVKWKAGNKSLWSFDTSDDFDARWLEEKAIAFYGPIQPPEDDE